MQIKRIDSTAGHHGLVFEDAGDRVALLQAPGNAAVAVRLGAGGDWIPMLPGRAVDVGCGCTEAGPAFTRVTVRFAATGGGEIVLVVAGAGERLSHLAAAACPAVGSYDSNDPPAAGNGAPPPTPAAGEAMHQLVASMVDTAVRVRRVTLTCIGAPDDTGWLTLNVDAMPLPVQLGANGHYTVTWDFGADGVWLPIATGLYVSASDNLQFAVVQGAVLYHRDAA